MYWIPWTFVLCVIMFVVTENCAKAVFCFNCVSSTSPGCGAEVNERVLLKSSRMVTQGPQPAPNGSSLATVKDNDHYMGQMSDLNLFRSINNSSTLRELENSKDDGHAVLVKCQGQTCLTQIAQTRNGRIYIRTCDISNVMPGQCNTVTEMLGIRLSVICVCSGDLCNTGTSSGQGSFYTSISEMKEMQTTVAITILIIFSFSLYS